MTQIMTNALVDSRLVKGFVEVVKPGQVSGWCYSPGQTAPLVVNLYVDDIFIRSRRADNEREDIGRGGGEILSGFNFRIGPKLLDLLPEKGAVRVEVAGQRGVLPLLKGKPSVIEGGARDEGQRLVSMLADKWHIDHWGNLHVSFAKEPGKIERLLDFYVEVRSVVKALEGTDLYLTGGNLLGLMREFAFLPHDDDVDAAFCVKAETPEQAADEFFKFFDVVCPKLLLLGYGVIIENVGQLHVFKRPNKGIDIFLGWLTSDKKWYRFTGAGGDLGVSVFKTREAEYIGRKVLLPQYPEKELELTYGSAWKEPDPHFFWKRSKEIGEVMSSFERAGEDRLRIRREALKDPARFLKDHIACSGAQSG